MIKIHQAVRLGKLHRGCFIVEVKTCSGPRPPSAKPEGAGMSSLILLSIHELSAYYKAKDAGHCNMLYF